MGNQVSFVVLNVELDIVLFFSILVLVSWHALHKNYVIQKIFQETKTKIEKNTYHVQGGPLMQVVHQGQVLLVVTLIQVSRLYPTLTICDYSSSNYFLPLFPPQVLSNVLCSDSRPVTTDEVSIDKNVQGDIVEGNGLREQRRIGTSFSHYQRSINF